MNTTKERVSGTYEPQTKLANDGSGFGRCEFCGKHKEVHTGTTHLDAGHQFPVRITLCMDCVLRNWPYQVNDYTYSQYESQ